MTSNKPNTSSAIPNSGKEKRRPSLARRIGGAIALLVFAFVAVTGGILWSNLNKIGGTGGAPEVIGPFRNPRAQFPGQNRVNILLIGKDYSYAWTKKSDPLNGARYSTESRSDTIMMLSLDLEKQKVSALSIPRDTWVTAPDGQQGKINGTYRRGGEPLLRKTVTELLGVKPDYFIAVKPDSVKSVVDVLGGVDVETQDAMTYDDDAAGLHIHLPKGAQTINGTQAIGFARYRKVDMHERDPQTGKAIYLGYKDSEGNPVFKMRPSGSVKPTKEDGDQRRMARQQQLIRAATAKAKSFSNLMQLAKVVNTSLSQIETDIKQPKIFALVALFRTIQPDQMQTATLEGKDVRRGRTWTFALDEEKKKAMVDWLLKGEESAANRLTQVAVQNGTDVTGAANTVAQLLREQGFDAKSDGNANPPTEGANVEAASETAATRIVYGKASAAARAQRIAQVLGGGQVVKEVKPDASPEDDTEDTADVTVVLGRDLAPNFAAQKNAQL
jgi:LCP family protein required for cell wall assembly